MAFFRTKVWQKDEILEVAKRKGEFIVDRNMYRFAVLRKKLTRNNPQQSSKVQGCQERQT